MIKKNEKFKLLDLEIELLRLCNTEFGFFQRFVNKTIPLLKRMFPNQTQEWEIDLLNDSRNINANNELTEAFLTLWKTAAIRHDTFLKRQLITLLRSIRGPRFEFLQSLIRIAYPRLKELYVSNVSIPEKFLFSAKTELIVKLDFQWRQEYLNCSTQWRMFWHGLSQKIPKKFKVISKKQQETKAVLKIISKLNILPNSIALKKRNYSSYPRASIRHEMEHLFAPAARMLYLYSPQQFNADRECLPKLIWLSFQTLCDCWHLRHTNIFNTPSSRIRDKSKDLGLFANKKYNNFLLIAAAEDLLMLDKGKTHLTFIREEYMSLLIRLSLEIQISCILPDTKLENTSFLKDLKMPLEGTDEYIFCDWYSAWLEKNQSKSAHERSIKKAISDFKKGTVKLKKEREDSTYKEWIRKYRKRKRAQLSRSISPTIGG